MQHFPSHMAQIVDKKQSYGLNLIRFSFQMRINYFGTRVSIQGTNNNVYIHAPNDYLETDCFVLGEDVLTLIIFFMSISCLLIACVVCCWRCYCHGSHRHYRDNLHVMAKSSSNASPNQCFIEKC